MVASISRKCKMNRRFKWHTKLYGYAKGLYVRKEGCCLYRKKLPLQCVLVKPVDSTGIAFAGQAWAPLVYASPSTV